MEKKRDYLNSYRIAFDSEMGRRLAIARVHMKLRQADLAALLGVTQDHIYRLESGKSATSLFSVKAFRSVMRFRTDFVLSGENANRYGYLFPEERKHRAELEAKRWKLPCK